MASTDPNRPNIVVVMSDDQGPWALGCAGNAELETPALDLLAEEGTRLDSFFCASPVCSPARASILTGRMPSAHGVHDWIRGEAYGIPDEGGVHYLEGLTTTPEVLSDAGWTCGLAGKWHLGTTRTPAPGFHFWYAHRTGDSPYVGAPVSTAEGAFTEERYFTDAVTEEALGFVDRQAEGDSPFYLSVNYTAPHSPWVGQHPQEWLDRYADGDFTSCPEEQPHEWFSWEPGPVTDAMLDPRPSLQGYFASITAMDAGIGRLVDRIDARGLRESTVVAFVSDNGFSCGQHGIWGKGNATWPLNLWENSVRVPAIVRQPGRVAAGQVSSALSSAVDLHPTLLALAGVAAPQDPLAAGRSLVPVLQGSSAGREAVFAFDEYGSTRMVRTADEKLVVRSGDMPTELYHLAEDPEERTNLAGDPGYAARLSELTGVLHDWFADRTDRQHDAFGRHVSGRGQLRPVTAGAADADTYYRGAGERRTAPAASEGPGS